MSEQKSPREEGRLAAATLAASAVDCPYLPGAQQAERSAWLDGFSEVRPSSSRASDPAHANDPRPGRSSGPPLKGYKEG